MQKFLNLNFVIVFIWLFLGCDSTSKKHKELSTYIPESTESILKIKNWGITSQDFKKNPLLNQLKDESFSSFFSTKKSVFDLIKPSTRVLLCKESENDLVNHFTLITKISPTLFQLDSIEGLSQTDIPYNGKIIKKTSFHSSETYSVTLDSVFIMSTSEKILKKSIEGNTKNLSLFSKAFKLKNDSELAYVQELQPLKENDSSSYDFASIASFDLQILPDGIVGNGVLLANDSLPQLLSIFKGQIPQKNNAASIVSLNAKQAQSFTFSDVKLLEKRLQKFKGDTIVISPLFESVNEIVDITFSEENIIALKSLDTQITWDELAKYISEKETYREVKLFDFSEEEPLFSAFSPLLTNTSFSTVFQLEDFIVFTKSENSAEKFISDFQNNTVLESASYFENANNQLAQASSITHYSLNGNTKGLFSKLLNVRPSKLENFPLAVVQLIYDRDFAHLNVICKETSHQKQSFGVIKQLMSISLDRAIAGDPKFFTNHNTSGKDIVAQDISNVLYLISSNGKILWKKQLDGVVLGTINEVDILRNGKKQLAFSTKNSLYVLDRNGKDVDPFPKKFKDPITQPVSVFDYDNNRKYRFIISQNSAVLMYDSKGETVNGFTFKKASSKIVLPPQHIRIGNKDYILIAEENGKLNILSRVGKERIKLNKTFTFSEIPIEKEGSNFIVITKDGKKETISQNGKIDSENIKTTGNYSYIISGSTKVTLNENFLKINNKLVELPLGIYSTPQVFKSKLEEYITTTDIQEKKVYVFNKNGEVLNGFPIFGIGPAQIAKDQTNNYLVVSSTEKEILLYQF